MTISSPAETLTIHLPAASARRLHRVAKIARRPIDDVIAEVLEAGFSGGSTDVLAAAIAASNSAITPAAW